MCGWIMLSRGKAVGDCRARAPLAGSLSRKAQFSSYQALHASARPEELRVDLLRPYQVFQLFQARKRPVFKDLFRHVNPLEKIIKLFRPAPRVPSAFETGKCFRIFSKETR